MPIISVPLSLSLSKQKLTQRHRTNTLCDTFHIDRSGEAASPWIAILSMEKKADVKAMMARFQPGGANVDETCSLPAGRIRQPLQPTLSSIPTLQTKTPVSESLSGSVVNIPQKPNFLKSKSDLEAHEPNTTKALAGRFGNIQDDTNTKPFIVNKQQLPMKPPFSKPSLSSTLPDSKPGFSKPALTSKPSWLKEDSCGGLQKKPSSSFVRLRQQNEEMAEPGTNVANKPSPLSNCAFKAPSNIRTAQNNFNKESESGGKTDGANKPILNPANSIPPPKPPANRKPSLRKPGNLSPQTSSNISDGASSPKKNPLPNSLSLGPAPAKPNRPPRVNLESFTRGAVASDDGPGAFKKPIHPTLLASHPSNHINHVTPAQPPQTAVPILPSRHPGAMIQQDDCYDDIDEFNSAPPPLPPSTGHPSQRAKAQEEEEEDGASEEMYEDLDERWEVAEQQQEKKKEKDDKEEKKRLEAEKKEQKEREKKEQDARKKFKLVGPLEAIHQGKACVDCRSSKNDIGLKQGDCLDIIRVQGNPEGKWLGRTLDGSIGYVKTTAVEIDFNSLKNRHPQQAYAPEVYDDIDVVSADKSGMKGQGVVLPPPPGDEGDIYDDILDVNLEVSPMDSRSSFAKPRNFLRMFERSRRPASPKVVPPPSQFTAEGNSDHLGETIDEEIYDDVDSQNLPPPPPISSLPLLKGKSKMDEMDPKKQKKFEKEEKDFRKKFKYEGEIQVLYQVTISPTLTCKKWSAKELPVKAGEKLDVIVKAVDNKLICRTEEGKFGYVSASHVDMNDGDIYDDIGDDCIYDND
ncbi:FYN-binding protein 1 isoform X1 [Pseudoliparis swirei]|uniref:FYN-binding protein 1 isoform X1 n=1 Tax=Pseudoliparis swirei TaxID=2059687 RepID=UPI0024BE31FD|nr:FYN-binding protein 1 isoform X1 [Pseudoliparis swirei]